MIEITCLLSPITHFSASLCNLHSNPIGPALRNNSMPRMLACRSLRCGMYIMLHCRHQSGQRSSLLLAKFRRHMRKEARLEVLYNPEERKYQKPGKIDISAPVMGQKQ